MKVGSLFTGYGGLDTAVGGELAWYAEIDKAATQRHWGATADTQHDGWNGRTITRGVGESQDQGRLQQPERRDSDVDWGKYAPAIQRWESVLDRPAPAPTVQRKDKRRLNPQFVEWMMGLDEGHVTGHGLSSAQELKMLGNGVVPQQARAAVAQLMERIPA